MTIREIFKIYPFNIAGFARQIGMTQQQLSVYVNGGPITERNRLRIQEYIQMIGKELSGMLITYEIKDNKSFKKALKHTIKEVNKIV